MSPDIIRGMAAEPKYALERWCDRNPDALANDEHLYGCAFPQLPPRGCVGCLLVALRRDAIRENAPGAFAALRELWLAAGSCFADVERYLGDLGRGETSAPDGL